MDLSQLTPEQKQELLKQLAAEKQAEKLQKQAEKDAYKALQSEYVDTFFPRLENAQLMLAEIKKTLFDTMKDVLSLKQKVYELSDLEMERQQSHSISNADFSKTIILGSNIVDDWDQEMASAGVARVNDWLTKKMTDTNIDLVGIIRELLRPNKDGVLKANRVLELRNQAEKIGDTELISAVSIIQESYRPKKTTTYVKAKYRNQNGQDVWLSLSMSNA